MEERKKNPAGAVTSLDSFYFFSLLLTKFVYVAMQTTNSRFLGYQDNLGQKVDFSGLGTVQYVILNQKRTTCCIKI